ncbi:hypothetical protein [Streptomyces sp. MAR4 CNX-425]|uniref:hypothetical protein n=1 Tax=Streptomyces sp. MAR4 CNX-425 TaxID=3406343 RepID=UPI003B503029
MEMRSTRDRTAADGGADPGAEDGAEPRKGRIELSGAQVAGGAAATMVAAFLASSMGVYGTIIGAGVVSVGATAGGAFFQHVFRRTGQQLKDAAGAAPKALHRQTAPLRAPVPDRADDETRLLGAVAPAAPAPTGGYGPVSTHGTPARARGLRRLALVAAGTFLAVMAVVFGIEKLTGGPLANAWGDDRTGTSFSPGEQKSDSPPADDGGGRTTDGTPEPGAGETGGPGNSPGSDGTGDTGGTDDDSGDGTGGDRRTGPGTDRQPAGTPTPQPGDGGTAPAPTPTPTPTGPDPGEGGEETPGTGESPAVPEPDGEAAPEAAE